MEQGGSNVSIDYFCTSLNDRFLFLYTCKGVNVLGHKQPQYVIHGIVEELCFHVRK
jgi:hypothetical protein